MIFVSLKGRRKGEEKVIRIKGDIEWRTERRMKNVDTEKERKCDEIS